MSALSLAFSLDMALTVSCSTGAGQHLHIQPLTPDKQNTEGQRWSTQHSLYAVLPDVSQGMMQLQLLQWQSADLV